jgi:hypothetical protein
VADTLFDVDAEPAKANDGSTAVRATAATVASTVARPRRENAPRVSNMS